MAIQKQQNVKTESGNRVDVYFGGVKVGLVQSVRMSDDYSPEAASGVGDIHVAEYVPSMARHSLTVQQMALKRASMRKMGVSALNGDDMLKGLVFDFVVVSKDTGQVMRKYVGVSFASGEVDVTKHAIITCSGMFNALDVQGEEL